jgi:hypothetical protein
MQQAQIKLHTKAYFGNSVFLNQSITKPQFDALEPNKTIFINLGIVLF